MRSLECRSSARQHACAYRAQHCYGISVRLSVYHMLALYRNECRISSTYFHRLVGHD